MKQVVCKVYTTRIDIMQYITTRIDKFVNFCDPYATVRICNTRSCVAYMQRGIHHCSA